MASSYTNTKRSDSKPTMLQKLLKLALYLAAVGMALAATATIVGFIRGRDNAGEVLPLFPYGSLIELTEPEAFKQAYLEVNCNAALLESTQTIRVAGKMQSGDNSQAFVLIKKRPDRMLFTIDRGSHDMTIGVSGDTVWMRIRAPQHEDIFALIEGEEAKAWLGQRRFFDRIISACQGEGSLTAIEAADWEGNDCLKVSTHDTDGEAVDILVDPKTMYTIAELESLADGSIKQTVFTDYHNINGLPIPFKMVSTVGGKTESHIILEKASLNTGVLSKLFDVPESLMTADLELQAVE